MINSCGDHGIYGHHGERVHLGETMDSYVSFKHTPLSQVPWVIGEMAMWDAPWGPYSLCLRAIESSNFKLQTSPWACPENLAQMTWLIAEVTMVAMDSYVSQAKEGRNLSACGWNLYWKGDFFFFPMNDLNFHLFVYLYTCSVVRNDKSILSSLLSPPPLCSLSSPISLFLVLSFFHLTSIVFFHPSLIHSLIPFFPSSPFPFSSLLS